MPAWLFGTLYMLYSMSRMNSGGSVGHAAHFGGGAFGAAFYFAIRKGLFRR